jgi:hypothetical protein
LIVAEEGNEATSESRFAFLKLTAFETPSAGRICERDLALIFTIVRSLLRDNMLFELRRGGFPSFPRLAVTMVASESQISAHKNTLSWPLHGARDDCEEAEGILNRVSLNGGATLRHIRLRER